ncbi:MAG: hypothetical protein AAF125_10475, partial [Chloroflexota bacterium]
MESLRKPQNLIILAFIIAAGGVLALSALNTSVNLAPRAEVRCIIGSEKDDFLDNTQVQRLLLTRYQLEVDYSEAGSIEQVMLPESQLTDIDCLWPSNTSAEQIFNIEKPNISASSEVIFNSPIVLYTWDDVYRGMDASGLLEQTPDGYTTVDMERLTTLMTSRPGWDTLNVNRFSNFRIITTDPTQSNSGNMFYALYLNMLSGGGVATQADLTEHIGTISDYYLAQGLMENSSGDLFDQYVTQGAGAVPIMANYESLLVELSVANPDLGERIRSSIRLLYPVPTVYSSHPLIALTDAGERLSDALKDPDIQQLAWEQHGFRTAVPGIVNNPDILEGVTLPPTDDLTFILPLPRP